MEFEGNPAHRLAHSFRGDGPGVAAPRLAPSARCGCAVGVVDHAGLRRRRGLARSLGVRRPGNLARHLRDPLLGAPAAGGGGDGPGRSADALPADRQLRAERRPRPARRSSGVSSTPPTRPGCGWSPGTCRPSSIRRRTRGGRWPRSGSGAPRASTSTPSRSTSRPASSDPCRYGASACCSSRLG